MATKNKTVASVIAERETLLARIEKLRDDWSIYADAIECTQGHNNPAAKAFRLCIHELYEARYGEEE